MKKNILIIGAGIEQVRAYELSKTMGLGVIGSDINPNAPAFSLADYCIIASTRDAQATVKAVKCFIEQTKQNIDAVITIANDVPYTVAAVANYLSLPSISLDTAKLSISKIKQKQHLGKYGISLPAFSEVKNVSDLNNCIHDWKFPIVLKPDDGRGARGVIRITPEIDLNWAIQHALENSDSKRLIAENFIEGIQLSTESMIYQNYCYTAAISYRNYEDLNKYVPFMIENGGTIPAVISKSDYKNIDHLISTAANAIGVTNNTVKGDVILSTSGPVLIELAPRLSGGYFCTDQIPLVNNIDLVKQTIKLALGEKLNVQELIPKNTCTMAIRYFEAEPGEIIDIKGINELKKLEWVTKVEMFVQLGDRVVSPDNHTQRIGFVHVIGKNAEEAEHRVKQAVQRVSITTRPDVSELTN